MFVIVVQVQDDLTTVNVASLLPVNPVDPENVFGAQVYLCFTISGHRITIYPHRLFCFQLFCHSLCSAHLFQFESYCASSLFSMDMSIQQSFFRQHLLLTVSLDSIQLGLLINQLLPLQV